MWLPDAHVVAKENYDACRIKHRIFLARHSRLTLCVHRQKVVLSCTFKVQASMHAVLIRLSIPIGKELCTESLSDPQSG